MVQKSLPGMPKPENFRPLPTDEYSLEPLGATFDGFRLVDQDKNVFAVIAPTGDTPEIREINKLLIESMLEIFNSVQRDGFGDG